MCNYIEDTNVMPGYICCICKTYNGLQREYCRACDRPHHKLLIPDTVAQCPFCEAGYPSGLPPKCLACGKDLKGKAVIHRLSELLP